MNIKIIILLLTGIVIMVQTCSPHQDVSIRGIQHKIQASSDNKAEGFSRYGGSLDMSFTDNVKAMWKFFFSGRDRTPDRPLPMQPVDLSHFNAGDGNQLNATWLGHSSLMINIDGYKILTDPVFEKRISIIGPERFKGDLPLSPEQLPEVDAVIISHNHYDHLNKRSIRQLSKKTERFIVPLGVGGYLMKWGVPEDHIVEMDWWNEYHLDDTFMVAAAPAQHFSGRGLFDRNKTLWASWVISGPQHKIFFSGDSGYFTGFKQIGDKYGPFDMTFLECGAYDRLWHKVHMFPEETVQAHVDLKGRVLHPIHWGTFNLALHPWYEPMERISAAAESLNMDLALPVIGGTTHFGQPLSVDKWWKHNMLNTAAARLSFTGSQIMDGS